MATPKHPPLDTHEAAEYLRCSESWLRQTRMRGSRKHGPDYFRCGKAIRYELEALEEFKARNSSRNRAA